MHANIKQALKPPLTCIPMIKLCSNLSFNVCPKTSIVLVFQVGGGLCFHDSMQHGKRTMFFHCIFMKFKLKNKLTNHLDFVVKMFAHDQYSIDMFPFGNLIKA